MNTHRVPQRILVIRDVGLRICPTGTNSPTLPMLFGEWSKLAEAFGQDDHVLDDTGRMRFVCCHEMVLIILRHNGDPVAALAESVEDEEAGLAIVMELRNEHFRSLFESAGAEDVNPEDWPHAWVVSSMSLSF